MVNREMLLEAALEWFLENAEENIEVLCDSADDGGDALEMKIGHAWALLRGEDD